MEVDIDEDEEGLFVEGVEAAEEGGGIDSPGSGSGGGIDRGRGRSRGCGSGRRERWD